MIISTYSEKIDRSISKPKNTFSGSSKLSMSYPSSSSSSSSSSAVAASSGSGSGSGIVSSSSSGSDGADGASTAAPYSQIDANPRAQGETMPGQVGREEEEEEEEDDDDEREAVGNDEPDDEELEEDDDDDDDDDDKEKRGAFYAENSTVQYGDRTSNVGGEDEVGPHHHGLHLSKGSQRSGSKRCRASTAKERISKIPPCAAGKRSSIYRGVTRHRWTGRYEAHLWDKSTWNQNQNKKGKQVYLGAYDDEEAAAHAYDLAALKYWGPGTLINFPVNDYARDIDEMQSVSRENYLASLRRKSSGYSRGGSKVRGSRHQYERWDVPQSGCSFASSLPQLNTYGTCGETRSSPLLGGASTMINLCHFMNWLQPPNLASEEASNPISKPCKGSIGSDRHSLESQRNQQTLSPPPSWCGDDNYSEGAKLEQEQKTQRSEWQCYEPYQLPFLQHSGSLSRNPRMSALSALSLSPMFTKLEERLKFGSKRLELKEKKCSESASEALANAIAMANNYPPPPCQSPSEGKPICQVERIEHARNQGDYVPLLPHDSVANHAAYIPDKVPCVWNSGNAFEAPLSMNTPLRYNHQETQPNMIN